MKMLNAILIFPLAFCSILPSTVRSTPNSSAGYARVQPGEKRLLCGLPGPCGRLAGLCNKQTHAAFIFFIGLLRKKAALRQRIHGHTDVGFGKRAQLYDIPGAVFRAGLLARNSSTDNSFIVRPYCTATACSASSYHFFIRCACTRSSDTPKGVFSCIRGNAPFVKLVLF